MTSRLRLRWLSGVVLPVIIVLLIIRLGALPMDAGGPSPAGQLAALVTCVLSGDSGPASSVTPSARATEAGQLDCDPTRADFLQTAWISAC